MKKTISLVLSLVLLLSLFGCSNSKYSKYSKSFLDLSSHFLRINQCSFHKNNHIKFSKI